MFVLARGSRDSSFQRGRYGVISSTQWLVNGIASVRGKARADPPAIRLLSAAKPRVLPAYGIRQGECVHIFVTPIQRML